MKVFCPEHKKGFFAPRQNPIKCDNRSHILGELNFASDNRSDGELHWQYCCNCEHFCPISPNGESLERCPVCTRRTAQLYVCDRCLTISFESSTPLETKNFTLTSEGVPQPACPGCLQMSSGEVREHACDELGTSFTTALTTCPICRERLDIGPSFPNLVSQFLRKTKATNKSNVTFDYDTGLFVEIEDGEFVLVPEASDRGLVMVVPRLAQLSDPREFYELYQDYYHHRAELRVGEVFIHEPALAERADGGWAFKSQGLLEIVDDHPKRRARKVRFSEMRVPEQPPVPALVPVPAAQPEIRPSDIETEAPASAPAVVATPKPPKLEGGVCQHCGSAIEDKYAFCWNCGKPMQAAKPPETKRPKNPSRRLIIDMDDVPDLPPFEESPRLGAFTPELPREHKRLKRGNGSGLKLILVLLVAGTALVSGMVGMWWLKPTPRVTTAALAAKTVTSTSQSAQDYVPTVAVSNTPVDSPLPTKVSASADEELRDLRQRRTTGNSAERRNVMKDFARLERAFPNDYRFPYERAKLSAAASDATSRDAAFQALFVAAQRAIKSGKAGEMLHGLETDKSRDFRKLARGRVEWAQIIQSLKNRDATLLAVNTHSAQTLE